jgi:hypothetical protein
VKQAVWKLLLVIGVMVAGGCGSGAQQGAEPPPLYVLQGSVRTGEGDPLVHASVALSGTPLGTVTDDDGRFGVDGIRPGDYMLVVVYLGYRSEKTRLTLSGTEPVVRVLEMIRDPRLGEAAVDSLPPVTLSYTLHRSS